MLTVTFYLYLFFLPSRLENLIGMKVFKVRRTVGHVTRLCHVCQKFKSHNALLPPRDMQCISQEASKCPLTYTSLFVSSKYKARREGVPDCDHDST